MRRALALARRAEGKVEPNPMVGCVLVRDGRVIGQGYHRRFGGPHAEVLAIEDARRKGHDPRGCDLFVTLEPCSHFGKRPPCTDAVLAADVARVFVAMIDPFPRVQGRGVARLREAGVQVEVGLCESGASELAAPFIKRHTRGLPYTIAKWAQTLDGRIASRTGDSQWISNDASRRLVHRVRGRVDAVVVGIATVLRDDPTLTARDLEPSELRRVARRVVIDPDARLPLSSRLVRTVGDAPLTVAVREQHLADETPAVRALADAGVELVGLPMCHDAPQRLDLVPLMRHLSQARNATNVLVEGGAHLFGSLFEQNLVDEVMAFIAPRLLGDADALPAVTGLTTPSIAEARPLTLRRVEQLGDDVLLVYRAC